MSTKLSIAEALKRVHLNTVTFKNEENARFIKALQEHIVPRKEINNFSEKVHEAHIRDFLNDAFYKGVHYVGKKDDANTDLCIFAENNENSFAQVLIECKNPRQNNQEMITEGHLNRKGLHEVITYYIDELSKGNFEVKYLIVTNGYDWFIFEALMIRELIATNELVKKYKAIKAPSLSKTKADTFYSEEVKPAVEKALDKLVYTYFSIDKSDKSAGIKNICKVLSPYFLLKQSYNDKYALNERFYNELLYIIGLEEKKSKGKLIITRRDKSRREPASLLENTLHQLSDFPAYINSNEEQRLDLALELVLMWVNRLLFIKLVESQLAGFNGDNDNYRFFNTRNIKDYNDLNELFFQVLAVTEDKRESIKPAFSVVPYLNSRLFELSRIEIDFFRISSLKVDKMSYFDKTVLADDAKKKPVVDNIKYIVDFLNHYDFGADSKEMLGFASEEKELINASVLGKIFEKINGYKDGAVFTPATITQFICQETLERAVIDKFNENGWACETIKDLRELINKDNRKQANSIVNTLRVCDPAVGSGHFLVSALNQLIEIKWQLGILLDDDGYPVKEYNICIIDDELVIRDGNGTRFAYKRKNVGTHELQKVLFREKRDIIENCLFGVDVNPNSVNICQLRLWIELLKNAYYKEDGKMETLPNIDINIKCGDSIIHEKQLDSDLRSEMIKSRMTVKEYKKLVCDYKCTHNKEERKDIEERLNKLKENIMYVYKSKDELYRRRNKELALWNDMTNNLFVSDNDEANEKLKEHFDRQTKKVDKLKRLIDEREEMYRNTLEWRFAFPEILDDNGRFVGFDCVVGNPPYIAVADLKDMSKNVLKRMDYHSYNSMGDICMFFYEYGMSLLKKNGLLMYITTNTWLRADSGTELREFMTQNSNPLMLIDFKNAQLFDNITVATNILMARKCKNEHKTMACNIDSYNKKQNLKEYIAGRLVENDYDEHSPWVVLSEADKTIIRKVKEACKNRKSSEPVTLGTMGCKIYRGITTGLNDAFVLKEQQKIKDLTSKDMKFGDPVTLGSMGYEINCGIKTGLNEAFVIKERKEINKLTAKDSKSAELIKELVRGEDLRKYSINSHAWILNVHNGLKEEKVAPVDITQYPAIKQWLDGFYEKLEKREDKGDTPYNLRNCAYLREFAKPKIMWGELSDKAKFALDEEGKYYCLNTVFFFTGERLEFLLCYLNSSVCEFVFSKQCTTSGTGTMRWLKYTVERITIPQLTDEQENNIVDLYHQFKKTQDKTFINKIDTLFYEYLNLDNDNIKQIETTLSK